MANGGSKTQRVDIIDRYNPSVVGRAAPKGTLFRYIPVAGTPIVFVKDDDTTDTAWTPVGGGGVETASNRGAGEGVFAAKVGNDFQFKSLVAGANVTVTADANEITIAATDTGTETASNRGTGNGVFAAKVADDFQFKSLVAGTNVTITNDANEITINAGGGTPTGLPNTVGFFNAVGNLSSNASFAYDELTGGLISGAASLGGSFAATAQGSFASGQASNSGFISAQGLGSKAFGLADGPASTIETQQDGSIAAGQSTAAATIRATQPGCMAMGWASGGSAVIDAVEFASFARGIAANALIQARSQGSMASGYAAGAGTLRAGNTVDPANSLGAHAFGYVNGGGSIESGDLGSMIFGTALSGGLIQVGGFSLGSNQGSFAHGFAFDSGQIVVQDALIGVSGASAGGQAFTSGVVAARNSASFVYGNADDSATLQTRGLASVAFGYATGTGSVLETLGTGSFACGFADAGSTLRAGGEASHAIGYSTNGAVISATGIGSSAGGYGGNASSSITASGNASTARGFSSGANIEALAAGAFAHGRASASGGLTASGLGSFAIGNSTTGPVQASGTSSFAHGDDVVVAADYGFATGIGHANDSYLSMMLGRFASTGYNAGAWIATDPLFIAGNGTSSVARADAFRIDKDGKMTTTAAQRHTACRSVSADTTLSARTDRSLFVDTATAVANVTVTFPAGEDGLEFFVKDSGGNAAVNNVIFAATGLDTIEASANITNNRGTRHFQFFGGVWYIMNLP